MAFRYHPNTERVSQEGLETEWFRYNLDEPKDLVFDDGFVALDVECHSKQHKDIRLIQLFQPSWEKPIIFDTNKYSVREVYKVIKDKHLVAHNAAFELSLFQTDLGEKHCVFDNISDTLLLARVKYPTELESFGFDAVCTFIHGFDYYKAYAKDIGWLTEDIPKFKKAMQKSFLDTPKSYKRGEDLYHEQLHYSALDVMLMSKVYKDLRTVEDNFNIQLDYKVLKESLLSWEGLPIDHERVEGLKAKYQGLVDEATENLPSKPGSPGVELLVNSWVQVRALFDSTESDDTFLASVENDAERFPDNSELEVRAVWAKFIRQKRSAVKALTFLDKYQGERFNGFASATTITGRLRQDENNLMQIARGLKTAFGFPEGDPRYLVHADYSGLEMRMVAARLNEEVLVDKFRAGADLHRYAGSKIYGIPENQVNDYQRFVGKTANFALLYGSGGNRFAAMALKNAGLYIEENEAKRIVKDWKKGYPGIKAQHLAAGRLKDEQRIGVALNGRVMKSNMYSDYLANPNQSSAADCFKLGLIYLARNSLIPLVGIHDSYIIEAESKAEANAIGEKLYKCMLTGWFEGLKNAPVTDLLMPTVVSITQNWGEAEKGNALETIKYEGTYEDYLTFKEDVINGRL